MRTTFAAVLMLSVLGTALLGCDNDPYSSRDSLPYGADFRALKVVDTREGWESERDSAYVLLVGDNTVQSLKVRLDGQRMDLVAIALGQAIYARSVTLAPSQELEFSVATSWRTETNTATMPATQPVITAPVQDSTYNRSTAIIIRWSAPMTGTLVAQLSAEAADGTIGDTMWSETVDASAGFTVISESIWDDRTDSTAAVTLWNVTDVTGEGFDDTIYLLTGLATRSRIHVVGVGSENGTTE